MIGRINVAAVVTLNSSLKVTQKSQQSVTSLSGGAARDADAVRIVAIEMFCLPPAVVFVHLAEKSSEMDAAERFGENLLRVRQARKLSQESLAERAEVTAPRSA